MNEFEQVIFGTTLVENSLYKDQTEYDNLLKDKEQIANALLFNLFGFISLFAATPKKDVKEWKNNEKSVRIDKITDENTDVTISIKLAYDAKMIPRSTVDKLTRMLALFKQGQIIKSSDINDDLIHDVFMLCKFDTINKPSPRLRPIVDEYVNRETNIAFLAKDLYKLSKLPDFKVMSLEFFNMYKHGAYAQVYSTLENGVKALPMGIPAKHLKIVTDKTVHHVKKSTVDVTGQTQIDTAVQTAAAQAVAQVDELVDEVKKTVASVSNPVEVVVQDPVELPSQQAIEEPTVDLDQKVDEVVEQAKTFDPNTDEMVTTLPDSPYAAAMTDGTMTAGDLHYIEKITEAAKQIGFDYDYHLSSEDAFIQGYKDFMMRAVHGSGIGDIVVARVNKYCTAMLNYVNLNEMSVPSWMTGYDTLSKTLVERFEGDDGGVVQSMYLITISYFLSTMSRTAQFRVGQQFKSIMDYFGRVKDINGFVKGKKLVPKVQALLQKHGADLNFAEVMDASIDGLRQGDDNGAYKLATFSFMFNKLFFDFKYGGDYKLDERFWVIKEYNTIEDKRVKPTTSVKAFYEQFTSKLVANKQILIDQRNFMGIGVIALNDDAMLKVKDVTRALFPFTNISFGSLMITRSVSGAIEFIGQIYDDNDVKPDYDFLVSTLDNLSSKSSLIKGLEILHLKPNFEYINVLNIFTKVMLKDIAERGIDSEYLKEYKAKYSMPLATIIDSTKLNTLSDPELKGYIERIRPMLFELEKMYDVTNLAEMEKEKIDKHIDLFRENETLLNVNLHTSIEALISDYRSSQRYHKQSSFSDTIQQLSKILESADYLGKKGVNVNVDNAREFIRSEIESAFAGTHDIGDSMYLLRVLSNSNYVMSSEPIDMFFSMVGNDQELQVKVNQVLKDTFKNLVTKTDFDKVYVKYPWLSDDLSVEFYDEVIRVNGSNVRSDVDDEKSVNVKKFSKAYVRDIFTNVYNDQLIDVKQLTDTLGTPYDKVMYDAIRHGFIGAGEVVDGTTVKGLLDNRSAEDIKASILKDAINDQPKEELIALMYVSDNPTTVSTSEIERVVEIANLPRDQADTFAFEMVQKYCKENLSNAIFRDMTWGDIKNLPEGARSVVIEDKFVKEYSSTVNNHLGDVNRVLTDTKIDLLTENISDYMLINLAKINGIGLQNVNKVNLDAYSSKEDFESSIADTVSSSFLDDINNTNVMELTDETEDPAIVKPINKKLYDTSNGKHGNVAPIITKVFKVNMDRTRFNAFVEKDKLNPNSESKGQIRQFMVHGTGSIAAAFITKFGFRELPESLGLFTTGKMLGEGIYLAENIDKSLSYIGDGGFNKTFKEGYVLMVDACLGEYDVDFKDAREHYVVSPEWCIKNFQDQIVVTELYKLRSATLNEYERHMEDWE